MMSSHFWNGRISEGRSDELNKLVYTVSHRAARYLKCQGLLVRDVENTYLQLDTLDDDPL